MENTEKQKSEIKNHLRVLKDKLIKFLINGTSPDILIIKSHLICEYYLNQILILKEICSANNINTMVFAEKNNKALDQSVLNEKLSYDSLKILNNLRNKVGHELEYVLSESDIDNLGFLRGKNYILDKYSFETLSDQLRSILTDVVIDIAMVLFKLVETEKSKQVNLTEHTKQS